MISTRQTENDSITSAAPGRAVQPTSAVDSDVTVTVVIPTTNRVAMLRTALASVRAQTARDRIQEVIVSLNSEPAAETEALCAEFAQDLPIRFRRQIPPCLPLEHEKALYRAPLATTFVAILHDDDWWSPEHLQRSIEALIACKAVASYSSFFDVWGESAPLRSDTNAMFWFGAGFAAMTRPWCLDPEAVVMSCVAGTPGRYSTLVARTEALREATRVYDSGNPFDNDRMLNVAFASLGPVVFCPTPTVFIRAHSEQCSRKYQQPQVIKHMSETTQWLLEQAQAMGVDFYRAFGKRFEACPVQHKQLLLEVLNVMWVRGVLDRTRLPIYLVSIWRQVEEIEYTGNQNEYQQRTLAWKGKLETVKALMEVKQNAAALRALLEAIKSVESCAGPRVTLEALLELCVPLGQLDRPRAIYLVDAAAKLAEALKRPAERDRALELKKQFASPALGALQPQRGQKGVAAA